MMPTIIIKKKRSRRWINPFKRGGATSVSSSASASVSPSVSASFSASASSRNATSIEQDAKEETVKKSSQEEQESVASTSSGDREMCATPTIVQDQVQVQDFGYEEASPDVKEKPVARFDDRHQAVIEKYGYEEAKPEEATPDARAQYGYGYEDDSAKYGYDEEPSSTPVAALPHDRDTPPRFLERGRTPRRSSMRQEGAPQRAGIAPVGEMEVKLPGRKGRVKRRTSISFDEKIEVTSVAPASSLTDKPEQLWFQKEEYVLIDKKTLALVVKAEEGGIVDGKKYCMRGLERMLAPESTAVKKSQAWDTVFNEQYLQRSEGGFNEDHMANMYKYSTLRSSVEATKRASQDAQDAETYLASTKRRYRRMSM
jgi:hypothetical protein